MDFEWDENKRRQVIEQRGVDMLYPALIFEGEVLSRLDDRENYGEIRLITRRSRRRVLRGRSHRAGRRDKVDNGMEGRPR